MLVKLQLLVIIPASKWQKCVSCMKKRELVSPPLSYLIVFLSFSLAQYIAIFGVVNDEAFFLSTIFFLSRSLARTKQQLPKAQFSCAAMEEQDFFVPYYILAMLQHKLPCILCYPRELFTFFLILLLLPSLHPLHKIHPPTTSSAK